MVLNTTAASQSASTGATVSNISHAAPAQLAVTQAAQQQSSSTQTTGTVLGVQSSGPVFQAAVVGKRGRKSRDVCWAGPASGVTREEALLKLITEVEEDNEKGWHLYTNWENVSDTVSEDTGIRREGSDDSEDAFGGGDGGGGNDEDEDNEDDDDDQGGGASRRDGGKSSVNAKKRARDGTEDDGEGGPDMKRQIVTKPSNSGATETASQSGATQPSDLGGPESDIGVMGKSDLVENEQGNFEEGKIGSEMTPDEVK
jgi:hypothetical protein